MNYYTSHLVRWSDPDSQKDVRIFIFNKFFNQVHEHCTGDVATIPGPAPFQLDFMFELESDASWFLLQYGGEYYAPNTIKHILQA
jgi:hypothetical protein